MESPERGLDTLLPRLNFHGILKLGLYSRKARETLGINAARIEAADATLEDIRSLRGEYMQKSAIFSLPEIFHHLRVPRFALSRARASVRSARYQIHVENWPGVFGFQRA